MYNSDDESLDIIVVPQIDIPVMLTEEGTVFMGHTLQCTLCKGTGPSYLNMTYVDSCDRVSGLLCPFCQEESLEVITYREIENG